MTVVRDLMPVLAPAARERLGMRVGEALRRARAGGDAVVAAVTLPAAPGIDPAAVVAASRRAGEPWFALEQPEREGFALATLGSVVDIEAHGPGRFAEVAQTWRRVSATAVTDPPEAHDAAGASLGERPRREAVFPGGRHGREPGSRGGPPPGAGLIAVGGFAFAPDGGRSPAWAGFPPAALTVPEVSLARRGGEVRMTLAALVAPDDTPEGVLARVESRVAQLREAPLPLLDPAPAERARVTGAMPPEHYVSAVARAVERICAGGLDKVVLAREVAVHAGADHDPAAILSVLREAFPGCYVFGVGRGDAAFVAASPELLVRREGQRASTVALAGSTRRSADPAVDDHLGEQLLRSAKDREEQAIVARRIERTLRERSVWVTAPEEPVLVRMANIQHLATPIRAQLAEPVGALDLAGLLHPTPAVGAEPREAVRMIPELEGMDRGWYAGAIGWTDAAEDGEFCVGLRCALLRGPVARLYAGVGVVRDSDPTAELAETEMKLEALLPVLAG
ncbi:MAG: menaquinone-specific isochorismate synthase [Solirubrobacteraceae bacterium]|nr:menaquinone-specific isochorismate synthase [Solirubrobacteraceae bacterium]